MRRHNKLKLTSLLGVAFTISTAQNNWKIDGNNVGNQDFIGTTNNKNFVIKTNNNTRAIFDKNGGFTNTGTIVTDSLRVTGK
ncbi:MAG: hypothetical protein ACK5QC_05585 [Bacteroidota bacterium]|jgi:hypothetical protein